MKVIDNGGLSAKDTVQITVNDPAQPNRPPVAKAGADQTITLPTNTINLDGSGSTDPDNNITTYSWTKISGPSSFNIVNANTVQTQATNFVQGIYLFELKVTDAGALFSKDTMQVKVNAGTANNCDNSTRPQINAQLIPIGTLSKSRVGMAVATAGSKIVYAGGFSTMPNDCPECLGSSRVDIYDMVNQTWSTAELSVGRWGISAIAAGNKIFFAGGEFGDGAFDTYYATVDIYDVFTNTWSVASLSQPRSKIAAAVAGNKVFFAGGEKDMDYNTSAVVDIYDISANSWSTSLLSGPRSFMSAITADNKIYFAGGYIEDRWQTPSNKIDIYDNNTSTWSASSLLVHSGPVSSIAVNDKIYWAAGCPVEIRNINTGNSSVAYLSKPGGYHSVIKDGKIVFIEGGDKFDIYDFVTNAWSIGVLTANLSISAAVISVNNIIYVTNGNQVWKLEF